MPSPRTRKDTNDTALVIGGTGKTGHRVARKLTAAGVRIRSVSRSSDVRFDWSDRSTWKPALQGVNAAYVTYSPDLAVPEAPPAIEIFARLAAEQGIGRLVLLSGRGEEEAQRCEHILQSIHPSATVVRASWFNQNFSEGIFAESLRGGTLALPARDVGEPFVDAEDIADVVVAALTEPGHDGRIYEVTGPRLLTFADAVREIAVATGRDLRYEPVPVEVFTRGMRDADAPESIVSLTQYLFETVLDGRNATVTHGVREALGRQPRDFSLFARDAATSGVWDVDAGHTSLSHAGVVRRFVDRVLNQGDESVLADLVHADYVFRSPSEELRGRSGLAALLRGYRAAFPDLHVAIDDLVEAGETTVLSFTLTGTHRGTLLGIPPAGRPVRVQGMLRSRFRDGRLAEEWEILDQLSLFEQLGAVETAG